MKDKKEKTNLIDKKKYLNFKDTSEITTFNTIKESVIGQDEAIEIIEKAANQKRHVLLLGEPGTGKSMLGKAIAEMISNKNAYDILSYPNIQDENNPIIKITKAGDGHKIVNQSKAPKIDIQKGQGSISIIIILIGIAFSFYHWYQWKIGNLPDVVYGAWIVADIIILAVLFFIVGISMSVSKKMNSNGGIFGGNQDNGPKIIVDNSKKQMIFEDASGAHEGALLGDVLHDPFQSGGLGTPAHQRIVAGMIHKANGGVLFIDEIATLKPQMQQELLTALQERQMPINGRSERSAGAMVRTTPVPTNFILVAAGNLDTLRHMHPALRSRIRGYGYEIYMNENMEDNLENRKKIIQFIAQEINKDKKIPHFTNNACELIIKEAQKRSDRGGKLTTRFRELGGIIRAAGDIAKKYKSNLVQEKHILLAQEKVKSIEDQMIRKYVENKKKYQIIQTLGVRVGKVNGLAVIGQTPPYSGMVMPIEAQITSGIGKQKVNATGKLGEIAKESIINISAIILKMFNEDIKEKHNIFVQFLQTHSGVEGDSASIAIASCIVSSLKEIPIKQNIAMTGSLSIRGEVLPIGGISAKIEGAYNSGITKIICPKTNIDDIVLTDEILNKVTIKPVEHIGEVLLEILDFNKTKHKKIIDKIKKFKY